MPELDFQVTGVEAAERGLTPLLQFKLRISSSPTDEPVQALLLNAQIQIQSPQRHYAPAEKEKLVELFGAPEQWKQTLRNRLWAHANATVGSFSGATETILSVPCTFDLNIAAAKYFYGLEDGDVPLLFLFSGSVFYSGEDGRLQVERVSWDKECVYRIRVEAWKALMERHYPNSAWLYLRRDTFERVYEYRRKNGFTDWEQAIESLLADKGMEKREPKLQEVVG